LSEPTAPGNIPRWKWDQNASAQQNTKPSPPVLNQQQNAQRRRVQQTQENNTQGSNPPTPKYNQPDIYTPLQVKNKAEISEAFTLFNYIQQRNFMNNRIRSINPNDQYVMQDSGTTPYGGVKAWSKGQILTGKQIQDIFGGVSQQNKNAFMNNLKVQQQTIRFSRSIPKGLFIEKTDVGYQTYPPYQKPSDIVTKTYGNERLDLYGAKAAQDLLFPEAIAGIETVTGIDKNAWENLHQSYAQDILQYTRPSWESQEDYTKRFWTSQQAIENVYIPLATMGLGYAVKPYLVGTKMMEEGTRVTKAFTTLGNFASKYSKPIGVGLIAAFVAPTAYETAMNPSESSIIIGRSLANMAKMGGGYTAGGKLYSSLNAGLIRQAYWTGTEYEAGIIGLNRSQALKEMTAYEWAKAGKISFSEAFSPSSKQLLSRTLGMVNPLTPLEGNFVTELSGRKDLIYTFSTPVMYEKGQMINVNTRVWNNDVLPSKDLFIGKDNGKFAVDNFSGNSGQKIDSFMRGKELLSPQDYANSLVNKGELRVEEFNFGHNKYYGSYTGFSSITGEPDLLRINKNVIGKKEYGVTLTHELLHKYLEDIGAPQNEEYTDYWEYRVKSFTREGIPSIREPTSKDFYTGPQNKVFEAITPGEYTDFTASRPVGNIGDFSISESRSMKSRALTISKSYPVNNMDINNGPGVHFGSPNVDVDNMAEKTVGFSRMYTGGNVVTDISSTINPASKFKDYYGGGSMGFDTQGIVNLNSVNNELKLPGGMNDFSEQGGFGKINYQGSFQKMFVNNKMNMVDMGYSNEESSSYWNNVSPIRRQSNDILLASAFRTDSFERQVSLSSSLFSMQSSLKNMFSLSKTGQTNKTIDRSIYAQKNMQGQFVLSKSASMNVSLFKTINVNTMKLFSSFKMSGVPGEIPTFKPYPYIVNPPGILFPKRKIEGSNANGANLLSYLSRYKFREFKIPNLNNIKVAI
jgi:hypothetical protein